MAAARSLMLFLTFSSFSCFGAGSSTAQVPLLMWSTEGLPPAPSSSAGHVTSDEQLGSYLASAFGSGARTVLLFLQDKLSKDDFTAFAGVFGNERDGIFRNLKALLRSSASSVTFPSLAWSPSTSTLALLEERLGVSPAPVDADALSRADVDASVSNLFVVDLPYCTSWQKSCREVLRRNDEMIAKVVSTMEDKKVPYIAMYTGGRPSRAFSEPAPAAERPVARSLLQAVAPEVRPPVVFDASGGPCIMLWARNLNISFSPSVNWTDLAVDTPSLTESMCNSTNSLLVLSYASGITLSFSMSQRFYPVSARNWFTLDSVQLQSDGVTASFAGSRAIYAPAEYSFRCQSVSSFRDALLVPNSTDRNVSDWKLNFIDFQIQGFGLTNGTNFSYASDCAGFFTPGIWMGLLTSLLMLSIFVYGLHMIMQLNAMDRFDDPKGPAISVSQSE
ncbi:V-type proton ATPase subunit S1-like isoform X2 [Phyllopteryx taeniolatus]|uniref:V-type proton ATPase subunit S1-like isoform X2 n=1 Tax=Phyllopteryx taeniolatus TaxID=161469 RepID=UPI002AD41F99|nr:V-type proton ATPase subunit S1-like isoform X2 [Phyllopteryx taeniolatus]